VRRLFDYLCRYEVFDVFSCETVYMVPWAWVAKRLTDGRGLDYGKRGQWPCVHHERGNMLVPRKHKRPAEARRP